METGVREQEERDFQAFSSIDTIGKKDVPEFIPAISE